MTLIGFFFIYIALFLTFFFKYLRFYFVLLIIYFMYNIHILFLLSIIFFILFYFNNKKKNKFFRYISISTDINFKKNIFIFWNKKFIESYNFNLRSNNHFLFFSFFSFFFIFFVSVYLYMFHLNNIFALNYLSQSTFYLFQFFSINFYWLIYIDSIAIYFIVLTTFIFFIVFFNMYSLKFKKDYYLNYFNFNFLFIILIYIEICLLLTFSTSNIFFFFFFFEASLIPLFILVQLAGKGLKKKQYAMFSLLFFTLTGSLFLLCGIFIFLNLTGSADFKILTFEKLTFNSQILLFFLFFLGFAFKAPMFPFYSWLPEAHVEASTSVSILLAAIFLKIAGYGILRIIIFNCSQACYFLHSFIICINVFSIIFVFLFALMQTDLKKIVALSSIGHMNYILIGLFSLDCKAIFGSILYMGAHALISSALFILIGIIYDNTGTRDLFNFSNIKNQNGRWSFFFFMFSLANVSFPGFISFFCELIIFNNIVFYNIFVLVVIIFAVFLSIIYTFWILHNILYGKIIKKNFFMLTKNEIFSLTLLLFLVFVFGFFPLFLMKNLEQDIYVLLLKNFY